MPIGDELSQAVAPATAWAAGEVVLSTPILSLTVTRCGRRSETPPQSLVPAHQGALEASKGGDVVRGGGFWRHLRNIGGPEDPERWGLSRRA
jgi:hypothetical protein